MLFVWPVCWPSRVYFFAELTIGSISVRVVILIRVLLLSCCYKGFIVIKYRPFLGLLSSYYIAKRCRL